MKRVFRVLCMALLYMTSFFLCPSASAAIDEYTIYDWNFGFAQVETEKGIYAYQKMATAYIKLDFDVRFSAEEAIPYSDMQTAVSAYFQNDPEIWYIASLTPQNMPDGGWRIKDVMLWIPEKADKEPATEENVETLRKCNQELNNRVEEIIAGMPLDAKTDYEKSLYLHDYIRTHVYYGMTQDADGAYTWDCQTPYGALIGGRAVCGGIADAYTLLLRRAGMQAWTIQGTDSHGEPHAWTMQIMEGECVYTDLTFDMTGSSAHEYFGLSLEQMSKDHTPDTRYDGQLPQCGHEGHKYSIPPEQFQVSPDWMIFTDLSEMQKIVSLSETPDSIPTYTSLDERIASVDGAGNVSVRSYGITYIRCTLPGCTVQRYVTVLAEKEPYGDVNTDASLSIADAVLLCRMLCEQSYRDVPALGWELADVNRDDLLTIMDVSTLLQKLTVEERTKTVYAPTDIIRSISYDIGSNRITYLWELTEQFPVYQLVEQEGYAPYCIFDMEGGFQLYAFLSEAYENENDVMQRRVLYIFAVKSLLKREDFDTLKVGMTLTDTERIDAGTALIDSFGETSVRSGYTLHMIEEGIIRIDYSAPIPDPFMSRIPWENSVIEKITFIPAGEEVLGSRFLLEPQKKS